MNYEQRYKEALKRAKEQLECSKVCEYKNADVASGIMETVYNLFPELKESEDEGIRESIAGFLKTISSLKDGQTVSNEDFDTKVILEWVTWLKKQGKQSSNILWHDVSEEPEAQREIFCEWKSSTGIWHSVVFYHAYAKTFCEGERIIKNVLKWTYVNEMLEKQGAQKPVDKVELTSSWKPTEKQINAIRLARSFVTDDFGNNPTLSETLKELEEQLRSLI